MHKLSDVSQLRSLGSLLANNKTFMDGGEGQKKDANKYRNCMYSPLINIELDRVSPPYIHILLGVVLKCHKLLEVAANNLGKKVAQESDEFLRPLGILLKKYGSRWGEAKRLQEKLIHEEGCLGFSELSESQEQVDMYMQQIHSMQNLISSLSYKDNL